MTHTKSNYLAEINSNAIKKTLVTDKSFRLGDSETKCVFIVDKKSNKLSLKRLFADLGLEVISININNISGKSKNFKRIKGKTQDQKRAIVKFSKESFEKVQINQ